MGTPDFAVATLAALTENNYHIAAVITAPDKPAGRGLALQASAVKKYAVEHQIRVLQPESLKSQDFIDTLKEINADLFIVVAFRMLPEIVWSMPRLGTFNLHASLLPDYRGAAPINHAIINGEKETGVTTFFINHEIDKGNILFNEKIAIGENETAGELHDRLMIVGSGLVLKTVEAIINKSYSLTNQEQLISSNLALHPAPKINKQDCQINWNMPAKKIHDFIRGLSPYPAAYTELIAPDGNKYFLKVFSATYQENNECGTIPGLVYTDGKDVLKISSTKGFLSITDLQLSGKKRMSSKLFLRGFTIDNNWKALI